MDDSLLSSHSQVYLISTSSSILYVKHFILTYDLNVLLLYLSDIGISDCALLLFHLYICNSQQFVTFGPHTSSTFLVTCWWCPPGLCSWVPPLPPICPAYWPNHLYCHLLPLLFSQHLMTSHHTLSLGYRHPLLPKLQCLYNITQ